MNKQEFLAQLRNGLCGLPQSDIAEQLSFYSEMIDDRMEEGLSEEDAVAAVGSVDHIVAQLAGDIPHGKIVTESISTKPQRNPWVIVLLILGAPIWLSLLISAFSVIFSLYISLWAVFGSLVACAFGVIVSGLGFALSGKILIGISMMGAGAVCAGLAIFLFYGCRAATSSTVWLTKKIPHWIKNCFTKKEAGK